MFNHFFYILNIWLFLHGYCQAKTRIWQKKYLKIIRKKSFLWFQKRQIENFPNLHISNKNCMWIKKNEPFSFRLEICKFEMHVKFFFLFKVYMNRFQADSIVNHFYFFFMCAHVLSNESIFCPFFLSSISGFIQCVKPPGSLRVR